MLGQRLQKRDTMASNSISPEFRIHQERLPDPPVTSAEKKLVSFVGSDEESFVVLGKSLVSTDFEDLSFQEEPRTSIIQEAKQLISDELEAIEQNPVHQPIQKNVNGVPEGHVSNLSQSRYKADLDQPSFHSPNENGIDQSVVLPSMPRPQLSPCGITERNDSASIISIVSFAPSEFASEELQTKVSQLIEENVHLKDTIMENNMRMKAQYEKIVAWQKDVEKVHQAHKEKVCQAKQSIETLKKDKASMKQDNDLLQQEIENLRYSLKLCDSENNKTKQILIGNSQNSVKEFELVTANRRIKELEKTLDEVNVNGNGDLDTEKSNGRSMEAKLLEYEREIDTANRRIRELEEALAKAKNSGEPESEKFRLMVMEAKLVVYEKELEEVYKKTSGLEKNTSAEVRSTYLEKCDQNTGVAYAQLEKQKNEIADLRKQLDEKQSESDAIFALRTQLDDHKADFEAEREAKEEYKRDNDRMSGYLQQLYKRNQELQEEIGLARMQLEEHGIVPRTRQESGSSSQGAAGLSAGRNNHLYKCRNCQFRTKDFRALETHLVRCVDTEDSCVLS